MGYVMASILQLILAFVVFIATFSKIIFGYGSFLMLISLTENIKCDLDALHKNARDESHGLEIVSEFHRVMQFHSDVKQLSK